MATRGPLTDHILRLVNKIVLGLGIPFALVALYGGWIFMTLFGFPDRQQVRARSANDSMNHEGLSAAQPANLRLNNHYFARMSEISKQRLRDLCSPTSFYVPLLSSILPLLYGFRAMEDHRRSLPGTEDYQLTCPQNPRRTVIGVLVKLFAATVTTVGVHGHLHSLEGSGSWKLELFRAVEVIINPLASVFSFVMLP